MCRNSDFDIRCPPSETKRNTSFQKSLIPAGPASLPFSRTRYTIAIPAPRGCGGIWRLVWYRGRSGRLPCGRSFKFPEYVLLVCYGGPWHTHDSSVRPQTAAIYNIYRIPHRGALLRACKRLPQNSQFSKNRVFLSFLCQIWLFLGLQWSRNVPGARGFVLIEYQPKRSHPDPVYTHFYWFSVDFSTEIPPKIGFLPLGHQNPPPSMKK